MIRPWIGLSADFVDGHARLSRHYLDMVVAAGGLPIMLPPFADLRAAMLDRLDGVILTGGEDIDVSQFGTPLHPQAACMHPERQAADFALLDELTRRPDLPVLGICLGMQQMGVHRGNATIQHLADVLPDAERHRNCSPHAVEARPGSPLASGIVCSSHHQALATADGFEIIARSDDGLIEGILDPGRRFYLGVQWHPERTAAAETGLNVIRSLVAAARGG